jgi:diguanylate cyclase (GGDEF)-like protein
MNMPLDSCCPPAEPAWRRLRSALLPDYNAKAEAFWWATVGAGAATLVWAGAQTLRTLSGPEALHAATGIAMAMLVGFFPLRVPGTRHAFAAGEIFVFTLLLLYGPAVAVLGCAAEAAVGAFRSSPRWSSRLFSPASAAVSMLCAGFGLEAALRAAHVSHGEAPGGLLLLTVASAVALFLVNTLLVTLIPRLKRNEALRLVDLFDNFGWLCVSYSSCACVAVLAYLTLQQSGIGILMIGAPIIALLLSAMHLFVRQQEANEAVRKAQMDAMAREQEQARRHLHDLQLIAYHDSLTGLPNRRRLHELLTEALQRTATDPDHEYSLLFLDFDRFKLINDTLGHLAGDEFLIRVSRLLQQQLRPQDVVARLGGDEFAILVEGRGCAAYSVALADRLLKLLGQPVVIQGVPVNATASIGITSSLVGYVEPCEVLRDADIAMYRAKAAGKARYALFDVSLRQEVSARMRLEGELRQAVARRELHVEYQPIFDLRSRRLLGFEALLRWQHRELGAVGPADFIPVAEETGMITQLTDFMLEEACLQLRSFQHSLPDGDALVMHVNISGNDLDSESFVSRLTRALGRAGLRPQNLVLELTENILTERLAEALPLLHELRTLGFHLSMDDFGTGSASLTHLSRLPLSSLKIDRSFVAQLADGSGAAIVKTVVFLARALGVSVIAEGIETPEQLARLCMLGCESGQGHHLAHAVSGGAIEASLGLRRRRAAGDPAPPRLPAGPGALLS